MRKGFGMIQVIMFMLLLSTILTLTMKYASVTTKQTQDLFLRESAELFMQSAIEVAILGIISHDRPTNGCIENVHIVSEDKRFFADINITQYYLFKTAGCAHENLIQTEASNGMVEMQIVVTTNDAHPKNTRKLRLTKRTLQRP